MYVCFTSEFSPLQFASLMPGIVHLQIAYGQTAGVLTVFLNALCGCY